MVYRKASGRTNLLPGTTSHLGNLHPNQGDYVGGQQSWVTCGAARSPPAERVSPSPTTADLQTFASPPQQDRDRYEALPKLMSFVQRPARFPDLSDTLPKSAAPGDAVG